MKHLFISVLCFILLPFAGLAQSSTRLAEETEMAKFLELLPAETVNALEDAYARLDKFSVADIAALLAKLSASDQRDHARIVSLANSYSYHVLSADNGVLRTKFVQGLIQSLTALSDKDDKAFVVTLLQQAGKDDAVPALSNLLPDPYLGEKAANALASIKSPAAGDALLQALPGLIGKSRTAAVQALGYIGGGEAEKAMLTLANSGDTSIQNTVLFALANIAGPSSGDALAKAARETGYIYEPMGATAAYLQYANNLADHGHGAAAAAIGKILFDAASDEAQVHTRIAALQLLTAAPDKPQVKRLLKAARHENREFRNAAFRLLEPHLTPSHVARLQKKWNRNDESMQEDLLRFFGETGSVGALRLVIRSLKSESDVVKIAAVKAYGQLAGEAAVPALLRLLNGSNLDVIAAVQKALLRTKSDQLVPTLTAALVEAPPAKQVVLMEVLGARAATESLPAITSLLSSNHQHVRSAAYQILPQLVTPADLNRLLTLLRDAGEYIPQVQSAITAAVKKSDDRVAEIRTLISRLEEAAIADKSLYFPILAGLGGDEGLSAVTSYIDKEPALHDAAIRALAEWNGGESLPFLIARSRVSKDAELLDMIIRGLVRVNGREAKLTDEQKTINLRDVFSDAQTTEQKELILRSLGGVNTYQALVFAGNYLDDPNLQVASARTVMTIALANKHFFGADVRRLLSRVLDVFSASENSYLREAVERHLIEMPEGAGYVSLFNGTDLTGWKGLVENPIKRAAMDAKTLAEKQRKADEVMRAGWKVENGELIFTGEGKNIVTQKHYGDFELLVDWKLDKDGKNGDAGVYLRGTPQVQIWDTSRVNVGAQVGSGGLYNNKKHESKPLKVADNPLGEWNTFKITMIDDQVTVYLNGELVTDNVVLENYWDREQPIFAVEQLELQAHGTVVYYRDIYLREISREVQQ